MKDFSKLLAVGAAALALAGCQTLTSSEGYRFEQVGQRTPTTVSVQLVRANKTYVSDTHLYVVHWTHQGPKATPRQQLLPLEPDAQGNFVYRGTNIDAGDTLRLAARVGPDGWLIYGSVEVR